MSDFGFAGESIYYLAGDEGKGVYRHRLTAAPATR
jgi:hypothetical protein